MAKIPRVVNLERLKHLYASFSIPELLAENGIAGHQLVAPVVDPKKYFNLKTVNGGTNFTPLRFHDNTEFDSRSADEWVKRPHGVPVPVPALAYSPVHQADGGGGGGRHEWTTVDVVDYDAAARMFTVVGSGGARAAVPKLQVHFVGEDPRDFVKRIKYAFSRRDYCEKIMLWYMYMDKINIDDVPDYLSDETAKKIWNLIFSTKKLYLEFMPQKKSIMEDMKKNYKRWHYAVMLQFKINKCPEKFEYIELPNFELGRFTKKPKRITTGMCNFEDMKSKFIRKRTVLVIPEIFYALSYVNIENMLLKEKQFLTTTLLNPVTLDEFLKIQLENITLTSNWLNNHWIKEVTYKCHVALKNVKNGWFDIFSSNLNVYESPINKLRKLMTLIQFMMEEYLRLLVENTIKNYANLIEQPCTSTKGIDANFIWGENLYDSPFKGNTGPVFSIRLAMNENGPFLTPDPDKFEPNVVSLLTRSVSLSHDIPVIHSMLLTNMKFPDEEKLISIGLLDEKIAGKQTIIENSIRSAVIPLKAYCREYVVHLPLFNIDVKTYVQAFFDDKPSLLQVRDEISMQFKQKAKLEKNLPENISISLFIVDTKLLRRTLIEKRNELATLLMKQHATIISEQLELICEEYKRIHLRLEESSVSIEQVFETREWIDTLPNILQNQSEIVKRLIMEMDMLDTFFWIVEYEQLKLKLDAKIWPYKIENKIKESLENLTLEIEKFEKIQSEDESAMQDKVEYITSTILKLTIENNLSKVFEIAVEVGKTWKLIKELQLFSQILNHRQKLFGHQVIAYDNIQQLVKEFEPYMELWQGAAEFLKMQNAWMQNPLPNLDRNSLEYTLDEFLKTMTKSVDQFSEVPGTLSVAKEMKTQVEEYRPTMELLKDILNPGMRQRHWDLLALETGVHIILSQSLTLKKCLEMGVGKYADKLKQISESASEEYTIELALNGIIKYWENVKLQIIPYEDTGTFIMKISDEEIKMLNDHILLIQQLSQISFKGVFEEQLIQWEDSLTFVKIIIDEWNQLQNQWMYLERIFSNPDIKDQLVDENIKFQRVDRTWRRIMKVTSNKPWVMTVCLNKQLLSTLKYANTQLNFLEKRVSNHLATKRSSVMLL